jgi:hypothetical protein
MALLSWQEIVERGKQHNKTVICEVEKRNGRKYYNVKCNECYDISLKLAFEIHACKKCKDIKQSSNKEEFVFRADNKHPGKYDYSLVEYINSVTKVKIICNQCNTIFEQRPHDHLNGNNCPKCVIQSRTSNKEEFILKADMKHLGKYDYSLVEYINSKTKVKIICNQCNTIFEQLPNGHLGGNNCPKCVIDNTKSNTEEFVIKAHKIHENKYSYDLVDYQRSDIKVKILCNRCNTIFEQKPHVHLYGRGCPKCNESKGELRVAKYLSEKNIKYTRNKIFKTLRYKSYLKPDFYLNDLNLLIEYDGEYHYKAIRGSTQEIKQKRFEDCQRRDKIKNEWAKANNIPLLRLPYWDFDRIEELIEAFIIQHSKKKEMKQLVLEM